MAETKKQDDIDPRHRLAQKYLQAAHKDLADKEADKPKTQRQRPPSLQGKPTLADLKPSISSSTLLHGMLLSILLTVVALVLVLCFGLLVTIPLAGRAIAMSAGVLTFIGLSYTSACYLGILESTSYGHTTPDDQLQGDWRDWFWTMPATVGVLLATAALGWFISRSAPSATWPIIGTTVWLIYPLLQLCTLETGSIASPVSLPVLSTLATRPLAWMSLYGVSFVLGQGVYWLGQLTWPERPYLTVLLVGPVGTVALLIYAWLLGQLARWLTIGGR